MAARETTTVSWLERIKNSVVGIGVGLVLVIAACILLFWNEGRAVDTYLSLAEGQGIVVSAPAEELDATLEGKLVHLQGTVSVFGDPQDIETGVFSAGSVGLVRNVEMFQWIERSESTTQKKLGGGEETVTTYTYAKEWLSEPQDSSKFKEQAGHENAPMFVKSAEFLSEEVAVGPFWIDADRIAPVAERNTLELSDEDAAYVADNLGLVGHSMVVSGDVYVGQDQQRPEVGDMRISYESIDLDAISVVAMQNGEELVPYVTSNGSDLFLVAAGTVSAQQLFEEAQDANNLMTWLLRIGGLFMMLIGFAAMLRIFSVIGDVVPFVGTLIGYGTGLVSILATLVLGSSVIAIGWFSARPLLTLAIVGVVGVFSVTAIYWKRRQVAN